MSTLIKIPKLEESRIGHDGDRVLFTLGGRTIVICWEAALEIGRGLIAKAHEAEEVSKAEWIAADQAVLLRAGVPIGLTNDPRIQAEAGKIAAWDSVLRRRMPGGVRSKAIVGRPSVVVHRPREGGA